MTNPAHEWRGARRLYVAGVGRLWTLGKKRLRWNDDQRRRLAANVEALSRGLTPENEAVRWCRGNRLLTGDTTA